MKFGSPSFKNQLKQSKPFFKTPPVAEKRFQLKIKNFKRLRIILSVNAGHVRGGHSFH
jgi:hypothetical protein